MAWEGGDRGNRGCVLDFCFEGLELTLRHVQHCRAAVNNKWVLGQVDDFIILEAVGDDGVKRVLAR